MSKSLLRAATERLKSQATAKMRNQLAKKKEEDALFTGAGTLGGAGIGALVDTKGQNGGPHKLFVKADGTGGVPTNIVAGVAVAVPALLIKGIPFKGPAAALGLSLAGVGLYRYIVDKHAANAAASAGH